MGYRVVSDNPIITELMADTVDDIEDIKELGLKPGSTVFVISDSSVYMLNTKLEWKQI